MLLALAVLILLALPLVVRAGSKRVRREWEKIAEQRRPPTPPAPPIERVGCDLRRLRHELELRENSPGSTGKGLKMAALRQAYVEVLGIACRQLEVMPPRQLGQVQTPLAEIYRVESELRRRGLDVRGPELGRRAA